MDFFLGGEGSLKPANAVVAIIVIDETSYLMQLRDQKPNISPATGDCSAERSRQMKIRLSR